MNDLGCFVLGAMLGVAGLQLLRQWRNGDLA